MTIFLVGDPQEHAYTFADAEMVVRHFGHDVLNPLMFPDNEKVIEAMIGCSDYMLLLQGWGSSSKAQDWHWYGSEVMHIPSFVYSPRATKKMADFFNKGES